MALELDTPWRTWLQDLSGDADPHDRLFCSGCQAPITSRRQITRIDGSHYHRFRNPYGLTFNLGCFRHAPGCVLVGMTSEEHTWFSGFSWQLCLCEECSQHLGWYYQNAQQASFFGLIVDRLLAHNPD